jgi:phosphohistidine phosphatase
MKTLYLLRHAKAVSDITNEGSDIDRELDAIGENEADEMGNWLNQAGIRPDMIYTSSAIRAMRTAQIVADKFGNHEGSLEMNAKLYNTDEEAYLSEIQNADNGLQTLMIVGHNPTISNLAVSLTKDFRESLPTGGFLAIDFDIDNWQDVDNHRGSRGAFIFPGQGPDGL